MSTDYKLQPLTNLSADQIGELFTRAYEEYFVPVVLGGRETAGMLRRDGVDLHLSRAAVTSDGPVGLILLALRGHACRVAAMGVEPGHKRKGIGRALMVHALEVARELRMHEIVLEVIEQNEPAVRLYESIGMQRQSRLFGYAWDSDVIGSSQLRATASDLIAIDPSEAAAAISRHGDRALPWQLEAPSIGSLTHPHVAYRYQDRAWCTLSDPEQSTIAITSLVVAREHRRQGVAGGMLAAIRHRHPDRTWRIAQLVPEGPTDAFLIAQGWQRTELAQLHMRLPLETAPATGH